MPTELKPAQVPDILTPSRITELMNEQSERGMYEKCIAKHVADGNVFTIVTDLPKFNSKKVSAVEQSLKLTLKNKTGEKNWPAITVVKGKLNGSDSESVLLVTDHLHAAAVAEENEAAESE